MEQVPILRLIGGLAARPPTSYILKMKGIKVALQMMRFRIELLVYFAPPSPKMFKQYGYRPRRAAEGTKELKPSPDDGSDSAFIDAD
ncbi:hypothetical protein CQ011_01185 [Arthrobacter sp. MYb213]|nr:hypothetical protein CQ011_01185 [Arthrobacter sp. MYb213]